MIPASESERQSRFLEKPFIGFKGKPYGPQRRGAFEQCMDLGPIPALLDVSTNLFAFVVAVLYRVECEERFAWECRRDIQRDREGLDGWTEDGERTYVEMEIDRRCYAYNHCINEASLLPKGGQGVPYVTDRWLVPFTGNGAFESFRIISLLTDRGPSWGFLAEARRLEVWAERLAKIYNTEVEIVPQISDKHVERI